MREDRILKVIKELNKHRIEAVVYGPGANFQYILDATDYWWQTSCDTNIMGFSSAYNLPDLCRGSIRRCFLGILSAGRIFGRWSENLLHSLAGDSDLLWRHLYTGT